jgi:site-specific recombinase XerD
LNNRCLSQTAAGLLPSPAICRCGWKTAVSSVDRHVASLRNMCGVKTNKSDAADAEAICDAFKRPTMRFVPIKEEMQQEVLVLFCNLNTRVTSHRFRYFAATFLSEDGLDIRFVQRLLGRLTGRSTRQKFKFASAVGAKVAVTKCVG